MKPSFRGSGHSSRAARTPLADPPRQGGRENSSGQALVEMTLLLPLMFLLTFGLLDYGRAYYYQVAITNAAREGTRTAILNIYIGPQTPSCSASPWPYCPVQVDSAIVNAVNTELANTGITPSSILVCPPHDGSAAGCPTTDTRVNNYNTSVTNYNVTVTVKYPFTLYTPLFQNLVGSPITMSATVLMRTNY